MEMNIDTEEPIYEEDPVAKAAYENFGIKYLFPWQRMVVANILEAYDYYLLTKSQPEEAKLADEENSDSFCKGRQIVLLPTGAGKSLCFQVPALLFNGPSLIIYPLIALMSDQQRRMEEGALKCVVFRGGQTQEERRDNFEKIKNGAKIILANPEVLKNQELLQELKKTGIIHVAIDEAHCVSEWGNSFRPSYLELGRVLEYLAPPVITAFTATASPSVLANVAEILFKGEAHVVRSESDRKNIHYFVQYTGAKSKAVLYLTKTEQRPMIVFCGTRLLAEEMSREINAFYGEMVSKFYHAGMEKSEKANIEKWFFESKDGVLCTTCAYGMGVDKKDIKTVVHLAPSTTVEAYIQEAGRGGRDGSVAKAILLWSLQDSIDFGAYKEGARERAVKTFAETTECRRQILLNALGGEQAVCSGCDVCNDKAFFESISLLSKRKMKKENRKYVSNKLMVDYELARKIFLQTKNGFSKEEIEEEITNTMNDYYKDKLGLKIWNHLDSVELLRQLESSGKISLKISLWERLKKKWKKTSP